MRSLGAESQLLSLCAPGESFWMYRVDAPLGGGGALEPVAIVESAVTEDRTTFQPLMIPSQRVCAKILEFVLGRSTVANSLDESGIVIRKLSYIRERCPDYWTLGLYPVQLAF